MYNLQQLNRGIFMTTRNRANPSATIKSPSRRSRVDATATRNTVEIEPLAPDPGLDVWISTTQACGILGIKRTSMTRLLDGTEPFLVVRRPLPTKILISLRSVKEFAQATK